MIERSQCLSVWQSLSSQNEHSSLLPLSIRNHSHPHSILLLFFLPSSLLLLHRAKQTTRIKFDRLTLPKYKGGIALPDLRRYYRATHLARIVDWNIHHTVKDWTTLEHPINPHSLRSVPWLHPRHVLSQTKRHPLIGPTLEVFHNLT